MLYFAIYRYLRSEHKTQYKTFVFSKIIFFFTGFKDYYMTLYPTLRYDKTMHLNLIITLKQ